MATIAFLLLATFAAASEDAIMIAIDVPTAGAVVGARVAIEGRASPHVEVAVSVDGGATWAPADTVDGRWTFPWSTRTVPAGPATILARARLGDGSATAGPVSVALAPVRLFDPGPGDRVAGDVTVRFRAEPAGRGPARVDVLAGDVVVASLDAAPGERTATFAADSFPKGPLALRVLLAEADGTKAADEATVLVTRPPVIEITTPGPGETYGAKRPLRFRVLDGGTGDPVPAIVDLAIAGDVRWSGRSVNGTAEYAWSTTDLTYDGPPRAVRIDVRTPDGLTSRLDASFARRAVPSPVITATPPKGADPLAFEGRAGPGSVTVHGRIDRGAWTPATVAVDGAWSWNASPSGLAAGDHEFEARAEDDADVSRLARATFRHAPRPIVVIASPAPNATLTWGETVVRGDVRGVAAGAPVRVVASLGLQTVPGEVVEVGADGAHRFLVRVRPSLAQPGPLVLSVRATVDGVEGETRILVQLPERSDAPSERAAVAVGALAALTAAAVAAGLHRR